MSDEEKEAAAKKALRFIKPGMAVGLGTGSTASIFIRLLGEKNKKKNMGLKCIATSIKSEELAREQGLELVGFDQLGAIDIAVDGADAIVGSNLIKGLGGALAREKVVDYRARKFIVIADKSKIREKFGGIIPVEVLPLAAEAVRRELLALGAEKADYRMREGEKFMTDNRNMILDAHFLEISNPKKLERQLKLIPGVLENGIFTRRCKVITGGV